jgi:hypothetical protein
VVPEDVLVEPDVPALAAGRFLAAPARPAAFVLAPAGLSARTAATPATVPVPTMSARFIGRPSWS